MAIATARAMQQKFPKDSQGYALEARALFLAGNVDRAESRLREALELVDDQGQRLLGLVPAYLRPGRLDIWYGPVVDCAHIHAEKVDPHFTVHVVALDLLGWAAAKNLAAQVHNLFDKLRTKLVDLHFFEFLQLVFIDQWTNEGVAVPSGEVLD